MTDERVRKVVLPLDWEHLGDAKPQTAAECVGPFAVLPWSAYEALREKADAWQRTRDALDKYLPDELKARGG